MAARRTGHGGGASIEHGGGASGARGRAGDAPVRPVSGGWKNLTRASASGVLAAEPVAAALLDDHGGGASNGARRWRSKSSTAAALGGHGIPSSGIPGGLSWRCHIKHIMYSFMKSAA